MRRVLVALLATTAAALASAVLAPPPAFAGADNRVPLPGVTEVGDVAAGGGRILVAAGDRVVVADRLGAVTGTVGGLTGAVALALTADGSRAYVTLREANQIAELDPARRQVVRRIGLPAGTCPVSLALARDRLWVGHRCADGERGGVLSLDPAARRPAVLPVDTDVDSFPLVVAAGSVLAVGEQSRTPGLVEVHAIRADGSTTRRASVGDGSGNLQDLALTPDGRLLVTAFGYPYRHVGWDTTTLAEVRSYGADEGGYPTSVAVSRDGTQVAAGRSYGGPDLSVHATATGATRHRAVAEGNPVAGALAFSGRDVVGVLADFPHEGPYFLWVARDPALPGSTLTLTGPASGTAGSPLTLTGRLTLAGGTAPGVQRLTVTRQGQDGTTALPPVSTGSGGRFTVRDPSPPGGDVTYTVDWAGTRAHRGSAASVVVPVAKLPVALTLTGPALAAAGEQVRLTGTVRIGGVVPAAPVTLAAYRITSNNFRVGEDALGEVTSTATGGFALTDVPPDGGGITYEVRLTETARTEAGQAGHTVGVSSRDARVTGLLQWPTYTGDDYPVHGQVEYETDQCTGPTTVQVSRQVGDGPVEARPAVTTDARCGFTFVDRSATPGAVRYLLRWAGDAGHDPATGEITGTISKVPTEIDVRPADPVVQPGQPVVVGGLLTARFTTPLPGQRLTVTRYDWIGRSAPLPDVTTGADGRFTLTDTLPEVPLDEFPSFTYEVRYAGTATDAPAFGSTQVWVRASD